MSSLSVIIAQLFKAYVKEADELSLRTYVSVFKQYDYALVEKSIQRAVTGQFDRMPTVTQLVKLINTIRYEEAEQGSRNLVEHANLTSEYVQKAIQAGWTLAQRDELIDICDRAINLKTGQWKWSKPEWEGHIKTLIRNVNAFREACFLAKENGTPAPSEETQDWAWAIEKQNQNEWDPAKESLWECVKRIAEGNRHEGFHQS